MIFLGDDVFVGKAGIAVTIVLSPRSSLDATTFVRLSTLRRHMRSYTLYLPCNRKHMSLSNNATEYCDVYGSGRAVFHVHFKYIRRVILRAWILQQSSWHLRCLHRRKNRPPRKYSYLAKKIQVWTPVPVKRRRCGDYYVHCTGKLKIY